MAKEKDELGSRTSNEIPSPHLAPIATMRTGVSHSNAVTPSISRSSTRSRYYGGHDGYCVLDNGEIANPPARTQRAGGNANGSGDEKKGADSEDYVKVVFDGENDPLNPRSMGRLRKWFIVLVVSSSSLCVTCTSSLYTSTYDQIIPEFHSSRIVATLGLSLFVVGLGLGPMVLGPLSEFYGRRIIYISSFAFFIIWLIPCALAHNMATMLIGRFLNGLAGSAFLSVAGGTVGDMFTKIDLSAPMMVYTASPFIGPELGPLLGGFINQYTTWRWSFYVLIIWAGAQLALIVFFVPETYHPVLLRRKAQKLRHDTGDQRWRAQIEISDRTIAQTLLLSCKRPFQLLFLEPMCLNLCLLSAILLGILYLFFGAFPLVFGKNHGFQQWQIGLSFLGIFWGMIIGILCNKFWHLHYLSLVRRHEEATGIEGASEPEFRLPPTVIGAWLVPVGLFGFAWTTYPSVHWIVPIIFSGIFGLGTVWSFSGVFTFLVECYPVYAASALAANSFARSSFAAAFPLFGVQMYNKLGYQWATTLLGFLGLVMAPFPYVFFVYGKRLRANSKYASA